LFAVGALVLIGLSISLDRWQRLRKPRHEEVRLKDPVANSADGRTLLVTGPNGFIGSRLADVAAARGYRVRTMSRSDWTGPPAVPVADRFLGSLPSRIPPEALDGVDVVDHCAGTGATDERAARAVNVEGTARLAAAAGAAGVRL